MYFYKQIVQFFHSLTLCVSVKSQRSVKHIWFLPTHKANAKKPKELALSQRT
jgi:hypothetical protein